MADRIRFHLDENIDPDIAAGLRRYGVDVTTTAETGLGTAVDEDHWQYARRVGRVLVTHDVGFLRRAATDSEHAGIAFAIQRTRSIGQIIRGLILIYEVLTPGEIAGRVEWL